MIKPIYTQLGSHNKISVGVEHKSGIYNKPTVSMTSNSAFSGAINVTRRNKEPYHRSTENDSKDTVSQIPIEQKGGFISQRFSVRNKDGIETHRQLERFEKLC